MIDNPTTASGRREPGAAPDGDELLRVENIVKQFEMRGGARGEKRVVHAVDDVTLALSFGETVGLVGETGCGKSTLGRVMGGLYPPTSGSVFFKGEDVAVLSEQKRREVNRSVQILFQDPYASLNPRMSAHDSIAEPLRIHGRYSRERVHELLELVGLHESDADRRPKEFSGGQRQRIGIARALALEPSVLVLDEPVSALDVSIQAQVLNLLVDLRERMSLACLFISHDLGVIGQVSDRVAVMYLGKIVEIGTLEEVFENPCHPYTQALISAVPGTDPARRQEGGRIVLGGDPPDPSRPPSGCRFRTRCWKAAEECAAEPPALLDRFGQGHASACLFPAG